MNAAAETFATAWSRAVADYGQRTFLVFENSDGATRRWTYGEFDDLVERAATRLHELGVGPGASIHLALANSTSFVATWLAAAQLGAWIVPSDPASASRELVEHLERTRPVVGLCATARRDPYLGAAATSELAHVIEVDESDLEPAWLAPPTPRDDRGPALATEPFRDHAVEPLDRAAVIFTSGTTGRPKGVVVTQANYAFTGRVMAAACDLTADDRWLVVLPLFHANAQYYSFAPAIAVGASVALMPTFSASRFLDQARRHGATCASLFAGPMRMILARGTPPAADESAGLRHCWFAQNLAPDQYEQLAGWLGCRPRQLYGMTETIPAVLTDRLEAPACDTMGDVTPGCQVDVQDADARSCRPGQEGEVVVGGMPGETLFAEYLDDPDTTAAAFRDGWFLTGDRAQRDVDGRHRFAGRRSDVLKVAGENVSTAEVEAVLATHPAVFEAAVVGAADAVRDEVPHAFIVISADHDPVGIESVLMDWCARRLSKAKRPRVIVVVDELPKTSVGKIRTFILKEAASR